MVNIRKNTPPLFFIENLSFRYPQEDKRSNLEIKEALTINQKENLLIQGGSGCGKSTLLYLLKGLIPQVIHGELTGKIEYKGKDIRELPLKSFNNIGLLLQNPQHQIIMRTAREELTLSLENSPIPSSQINDKIIFYQELFRLQNLIDKPLEQLSGGELQRVALASLLACDSEIILFDEPTAFLDAKNCQLLMKILKNLKNKTFIFIEHNSNFLAPLIDRTITLENSSWHEDKIKKPYYVAPYPSSIKEDSPIVLELKELSFSFHAQKEPILNKVNLTARRGEIIGIMGNNGEGKSTLFNLISRIFPSRKKDSLSPQSIYLDQQEISLMKKSDYYKKLSYLLQNPEYHFIRQTVQDELDHGRLHYAELNHETEEAILFHLEDHLEKSPFSLSEGQKRRLSLAIMYRLNREIFLLDEPTFGQDATNKQALIEILQRLALKRKTIIIISHDISFLKVIAHSLYELRAGKLRPVSKEEKEESYL